MTHKKTKIHLVIPDGHTQPGVPNDRYDWLGRLIVDIRPDVIINLGDHWDFKSLCSYDKGTRGYEARRYNEDVAAGVDANTRMLQPLYDLQTRQCSWKKKEYRPRLIFTVGNHEQRIERALDAEPILQGTIGFEDLALTDHGVGAWEVYNYLTPVIVDGVTYCHFMQVDKGNRALSGIHLAYNLLQKNYKSVTVGHLHSLDYKVISKASIMGLVGGCFFSHHEEWAKQSNETYWRGIIIKRNVKDGMYDLETMTIDRLQELYG